MGPDDYVPFGWPQLPQVGGGQFGLPYLPPLPPRAVMSNPPPRPGDPVAGPVAEGIGPLGPFLPGMGRDAGPAGNLLSRYLPWGAAGAVTGAPIGALDYAASGDSPIEGAAVGAVRMANAAAPSLPRLGGQ